jgi:transketolase
LRAIPNVVVIRPADANETIESWKVALNRKTGPTILVLSRQSIPTLDRRVVAPAAGLSKGAYILREFGKGKPQLILMASGSEVSLSLLSAEKLAEDGISVRVVSFPSWELFEAQENSYKEMVLPPDIPHRLSIEMGISLGWERWLGSKGASISIEKYGASAPEKVLFEKYGFTVSNICQVAQNLLG